MLSPAPMVSALRLHMFLLSSHLKNEEVRKQLEHVTGGPTSGWFVKKI